MITLNSLPIICAQISLPSVGAWSATVTTANEITVGRCVLSDTESGNWTGTVTRTGGASGVYTSKVVGGGGGLSSAVSGQHFRSLQPSGILAALAAPLGEALSPLTDPFITSSPLSFFSVSNGTLAQAIADLAGTLGVDWRIGQDGGIWLGTGRIPGVPIDSTPRVSGLSIGSGMLTAALDGIELWPGDALSDLLIKSIEYYFESESTRALIRI